MGNIMNEHITGTTRVAQCVEEKLQKKGLNGTVMS